MAKETSAATPKVAGDVGAIRRRVAVVVDIVMSTLVLLYVTGAMLFDPVSAALRIVMSTLVLLYVTGAMLFDPVSAALRLSGGAFVLAVALASAAFSYSRANLPPAVSREVTFAGGHLLQAAVWFLIASLLKYGSEAVPRHALALMNALLRLSHRPTASSDPFSFSFFVPIMFDFLAFVFASCAVVVFQSGLFRLTVIAAHKSQFSAHPGYRISADAYRRCLDRITTADNINVEGRNLSGASVAFEARPPDPHIERGGTRTPS